jgi:tetratricopeptide (TPR) repeat protein
MVGRPKVFISYSHDSPAHSERVRILADRLCGDSVDCTIDQYDQAPAEGWPRWMDRQVEETDFVLIVCTPTYYRKARGQERQGIGHGVIFESVLIVQDLYDAGMRNEKFIPVLFEDLDLKQILSPLRGYTRYRVDTQDGYEALLRHLTGQPRIVKPALGPLPVLPPEASPAPSVESAKPAGEEGGLPATARRRRWLLAAISLSLLLVCVLVGLRLLQGCSGRPDFLPPDREARERYLEGLVLMARFDFPLARRSFERVLQIKDFPPARSVLAEALVRLDLGDAATNEAQQALAGSSRLPPEERLQIEARLLRLQGKWERAVQAYHRLMDLYPRSCMRLDYSFGLVESLIGAGKGREALQELNSLQPLAKKDPRLYLWESWAAGSVRDYAAQRAAATKAIAAVEGKEGYRQLEAKARLLRGIALIVQSGDLDTATSDLDKAQRYYTQAYNQRGGIQALDVLAGSLFSQGKLALAERARRRAAAAYQDLKDPQGLASQHNQLAQVLSERGELKEAQSLAELAVKEFGELGDNIYQAQALGDLGLFLQRQGKLAEAIQRCRQAIKLAQDSKDQGEEARQLANLAEVRLQGMEPREAEESFRQSQQRAKEANDPQAIVSALMGLGKAAIARGDLDQAEKSYGEALDWGRRLKEDRILVASQFGLATVLLEKGRPEDAADQLKEALALLGGKRKPDEEAEGEALLARALLAQDQPADAQRAVERAHGLAEPIEFPELHVKVALAEAQVRDRMGEQDAAIRILQEALARAQQVGFAPEALAVRLILGGIEARRGDRSPLEGVEQEARTRGFLLIARKARRLLDGHSPVPA